MPTMPTSISCWNLRAAPPSFVKIATPFSYAASAETAADAGEPGNIVVTASRSGDPVRADMLPNERAEFAQQLDTLRRLLTDPFGNDRSDSTYIDDVLAARALG